MVFSNQEKLDNEAAVQTKNHWNYQITITLSQYHMYL